MDGVIVDLDGTVYRGETLLPGAADGVDALRSVGLDVLFFSNNPVRDSEAYATRLTEFGIPTEPHEACSSGVVTTEYLRKNHPAEDIFLIGDDGLRDQFLDAGLELTATPEDADVLLASWTAEFGYTDLQAALDATEKQIPFYGTDPDRTFPDENGRDVPGSGAIIGSVARTIGREPDEVLGKPSTVALEYALGRLDTNPESCLVVGDRLDTDLLLGDRAGMTTVLVETGIADSADIDDSPVTPDFVVDSLGDIESVLSQL
ncbi:Haloacid Dehalogenase Superfamily Class (subfamily) IIA [Halovenus aranensis]|uniref:Haloacid Dehalogenase Superfamily Class (Subfamily) IIA n=1 Tax=Halovenus aranensis TaxID=890420 RepID=A0A1G8UBA2_9EURY|nr:HAD-IIA family hydrolase [Halovenus aranensis]SDJ51049.1 Haloacid Dehalogenase Superfamily Class (subfamily) IIA [Halovenus aranensis]